MKWMCLTGSSVKVWGNCRLGPLLGELSTAARDWRAWRLSSPLPLHTVPLCQHWSTVVGGEPQYRWLPGLYLFCGQREDFSLHACNLLLCTSPISTKKEQTQNKTKQKLNMKSIGSGRSCMDVFSMERMLSDIRHLRKPKEEIQSSHL